MSEPQVQNQEENRKNDEVLLTEDEVEAQAKSVTTWPMSILKVAPVEKPKFFHMFSMFFFIAYIYSVLRDTKDAVVMERQETASINFLKSLFVTPFSILVVMLIQKWLTVASVARILKYVTLIFGVYFCVYGVIILTFQEQLEFNKFLSIDAFGDGKMAVRGLHNVYSFILTINFWTSSLLYVSSELWGNIVLSLLFLSFANEVCPFKQSIRFIPLFYIGSNFGLFLSGLSMLGFCYIQDNAPYWINSLVINFIFCFSGFLCLCIFYIQTRLENKILCKPLYTIAGEQKRKSKPKTTYVEGLKYMIRSYLLLQICFIVFAYNVCTNLIDGICKSAIKEHAKMKNLSIGSHVMRTQAINQIAVSTIVVLILCSPMARCIQIIGWTAVGFITPVWSIACTFFVLIVAAYNTGCTKTNHLKFVSTMFGDNDPWITYEMRAGQVATNGMKIMKYAFFDLAKEAISMRISKDDRAFFKSIYDGICGKLGKSSGGVIQTILNSLTDSVDVRNGAQYFVIIIALISVFWVYSVKYLGNKYNESVNNNCDIDIDLMGKKKPQYNA